MANTFRLTGSYVTVPIPGPLSAAPALDAPICETVQLQAMGILEYLLDSDSPVSVPIASTGVDNVNVLIVKSVGGKVRVRITSADGATQAIPVDSLLILTDYSVPITAIDLTRAAGVQVSVRLFLGEKA